MTNTDDDYSRNSEALDLLLSLDTGLLSATDVRRDVEANLLGALMASTPHDVFCDMLDRAAEHAGIR